MIKLNNSIKVIVPVTNNDGVKVDFSSEIKTVINTVGGATTYPARGSWVEKGKLYTDSIDVVQFNCDEFDTDTNWAISHLVSAIFDKAEQLAVSVEINGTLYILDNSYEIFELLNQVLDKTFNSVIIGLSNRKGVYTL